MYWGNKPTDGGNLILETDEKDELLAEYPNALPFIRTFLGSKELIQGLYRYCLWIDDDQRNEAEIYSADSGAAIESGKLPRFQQGS